MRVLACAGSALVSTIVSIPLYSGNEYIKLNYISLQESVDDCVKDKKKINRASKTIFYHNPLDFAALTLIFDKFSQGLGIYPVDKT